MPEDHPHDVVETPGGLGYGISWRTPDGEQHWGTYRMYVRKPSHIIGVHYRQAEPRPSLDGERHE